MPHCSIYSFGARDIPATEYIMVSYAWRESLCLLQRPLTSKEGPRQGSAHVYLCLSPPTVSLLAVEKEISSPKKAFGLNSTICLDTLASCKHRATVNSESLGVAVQQRSD